MSAEPQMSFSSLPTSRLVGGEPLGFSELNSETPTVQAQAVMSGGRKRKHGGRGLTEIAVPALLLYANTVYKPSYRKSGKKRKFRGSRKSRRSRRR
jgi:hypothetical protein